MTLKFYLEHGKSEPESQKAFAARIGSSQGEVSKWLSGKVLPSVETRLAIQKHTRGLVDALKDWPRQLKAKASEATAG